MALTFANKVTVGRILMIPFFIVTILYYSPQREYLRQITLGLFLVAVLTDIIDGYIARTRQQKTKAGAMLDPLADKLLLISAFVCLYRIGPLLGPVRFPLWFVLSIISRDIILLVGSMLIFLVHGDLNIDPSKWGKATTFLQILCIFGILLQWRVSPFIWYVAFILTIISAIGYIRSGIKVLNIPPSEKTKIKA